MMNRIFLEYSLCPRGKAILLFSMIIIQQF